MHEVPLRRTKHLPKSNLNPNAEPSDFFDRRGLLDLPVSLPSIPLLNPLITPLVGGPKPTPTPGNNKPNPAPTPQHDPPQPPPANIPDPGNGNGNGNGNNPGNGGGGGDKTPNSGDGNTGVPNPNPNSPPNPDPNSPPNPDLNTPPNPNPNTPPNPPTPTPNPGSPDSGASDPSKPSPTSGSPPSQPSGVPQGGSVHLSEPNPGGTSPGDSPGGPDGSGSVVFTTISGVRTEVTQLPHPSSGDGSTNEDGNGLVNGSGDGSGGGTNSSEGGGLGRGVVAAIVICCLLALALFLFFLRKRVKKRRAAQRTRWLSSDERGPRSTIRSSFGDLRASTFGIQSDDGNDSGPFSDKMAVPTPTPGDPSDRLMMQATSSGIILPATAMHSTGRRSSRNSQFSIGSSESSGTDVSDSQWVEVHPRVGYRDNASPTDQFYLPSSFSVRPFTPTESWIFPKPPSSRVASLTINRESEGSLVPDPFADPIPQLPPPGLPPVERVMRTFDREAADELMVEVGDEVSVLSVFDDGWGRVKVLRRKGSAEGVQGLEGLIPIECLKPEGNKEGANFTIPGKSMFDVGKFSLVFGQCFFCSTLDRYPRTRPLNLRYCST